MATQKPHIVCIPCPFQGHINPTIKLINILHYKGFYITLVLTEFIYATLTSSLGEEFRTLQSIPDFRIETIPDGLPLESKRGALEIEKLIGAFLGDDMKKHLRGLLMRLHSSSDIPPVSSIIADAFIVFPVDVGKELEIPVVLYITTSACYIQGLMQHDELIKRGYIPLKDESYLTNGYIDKQVDWIPGLIKGVKLKYLFSSIQSIDTNGILFKFEQELTRKILVADGLIFNTFADLEGQVLLAMKDKIPKHYTVGPLPLLCQDQLNGQEHLPLTLSLWKEDSNCLKWLNKRGAKSVIYVNFGSLVTFNADQLREFAWGLANSNHSFLWVIRSDLVDGVSNIITNEFMEEIKERGLLLSWCPQEKVLQHPSIAVFLTHCGWNSTLESICQGVPMICWSYFGDQHINSLYACQEWKIALKMEEYEVKRENVEQFVREMMEGEKGKDLKRNTLKLKKKAEEATIFGGSSYNNFDELMKYLLERSISH